MNDLEISTGHQNENEVTEVARPLRRATLGRASVGAADEIEKPEPAVYQESKRRKYSLRFCAILFSFIVIYLSGRIIIESRYDFFNLFAVGIGIIVIATLWLIGTSRQINLAAEGITSKTDTGRAIKLRWDEIEKIEEEIARTDKRLMILTFWASEVKITCTRFEFKEGALDDMRERARAYAPATARWVQIKWIPSSNL